MKTQWNYEARGEMLTDLPRNEATRLRLKRAEPRPSVTQSVAIAIIRLGTVEAETAEEAANEAGKLHPKAVVFRVERV